MTSNKLWLIYALCAITPALWSANSIVGRLADGTIAPHLLSLLRWSFALIVMLPFAIRELLERWPEWRSEWIDIFFLACFGMWISGTSIYIGAQTTQAINISLIYSTGPILITIVSAFWFNERVRLTQWGGFVLAIAGMWTIVSKGSADNLAKFEFSPGDWWIIISVLAWVGYSLILKNRQSCLTVSSRVVAITLGGVIILIPGALIEFALSAAPVEFSSKALVLVIVAALLPSAGAYHAYAYIQQEIGAPKASVVMYLVPLYVALGAWGLLGESLEAYHYAGAAFIIPGLFLALRQRTT